MKKKCTTALICLVGLLLYPVVFFGKQSSCLYTQNPLLHLEMFNVVMQGMQGYAEGQIGTMQSMQRNSHAGGVGAMQEAIGEKICMVCIPVKFNWSSAEKNAHADIGHQCRDWSRFSPARPTPTPDCVFARNEEYQTSFLSQQFKERN